jgi:hypothetical protein
LSSFEYNISETKSVSVISCEGVSLGLKERMVLNQNNCDYAFIISPHTWQRREIKISETIWLKTQNNRQYPA